MIVLYNPLSTTPGKQPLPLSLMALAAVIRKREPWTLVDGNVERDPAGAIVARLTAAAPGELRLLAVTVMPGPQLTQAVEVCRRVREALRDVPIVWGGDFPTQYAGTCLLEPFVDFVVRSQGERAILDLIETLRTSGSTSIGRVGVADRTVAAAQPRRSDVISLKVAGRGTPSATAVDERRSFETIGNLSWKTPDGRIVHNEAAPMTPLDELPDVPYEEVVMTDYIHPTYLGRRTVAYNSSFGCPFSCSFCAVVAMSNRRWLAQTPARMEHALRHLKARYAIDAVQMHDMDFFISEARTAEFAERIAPLGLTWWALGRVDTLMQYSDATWEAIARSGLKMVFSGAESASDAVLAAMNKGGKSAAGLAIELAARMRTYGIIPEYSFVLGSPPDPLGDLEQTFEFIRAIKRVNPSTEVVLYTYTPVPMEGALYEGASRLGFRFPTTLDEWASDEWRQLMMRRGDGIPWVDGSVRRRVRNFERVLNAFYPTVTDRRITPARRRLLRSISSWRYALKLYGAPYELRALQRLIHYQRPETTGF